MTNRVPSLYRGRGDAASMRNGARGPSELPARPAGVMGSSTAAQAASGCVS